MSWIRRGCFGGLLTLGVLGPTACFDPDQGAGLETGGNEDGSTGETGDGGEDSTGEGEAPPQVDPCPDYCQLMDDHCDGDLAQYPGQAICEATCALMEPGEETDVLGNTASCRAHHALLAAESADPHCLHAGPTGDTTCGGPCESFCSLALVACPGELSPFLDADDCIAQCEAFDPEPRYSASVTEGDSYACRMHHLTLAALQSEVHCSHIATDSPVCRDDG